MKVRPSVKRICEKCQKRRRKGTGPVICANPKHSRGRASRMARVRESRFPAGKQAWVSLTYNSASATRCRAGY